MQEAELYHTLREREELLMRELQSITDQLRVCREMRSSLAPTLGLELPPLPPAPAAEAAALPVAPAVPTETVPSPASPLRKMIFAPTAEELAELRALAESSRRGRLVARVELAIAQCGETFSMQDVLRVFHTQFGWRNEPLDNGRIGNAFWKAVQKRGYRLIRQGSGRTPSLYSKF